MSRFRDGGNMREAFRFPESAAGDDAAVIHALTSQMGGSQGLHIYGWAANVPGMVGPSIITKPLATSRY